MVQSILAQTYHHWELLIVAVDSPTDGSYKEAKRLESQDPRIHVEVERRPGFAVNVNAAFAMSKGKIIARQEADDWSDPTRLEKQVALMQGGYNIVSCGMVRVMQNGTRKHMDVGGMNPFEFCTFCCPHGPGSDSIVAWRWTYDRVGLYDPKYDASADTDWTFRALAEEPPFTWGHVPEDLYVYRDHPEQMTKRIGEEGAAIHLERQAHYRDQIRAVFHV
jgi:glycosyltransferase involved in cell wall biosynthesis